MYLGYCSLMLRRKLKTSLVGNALVKATTVNVRRNQQRFPCVYTSSLHTTLPASTTVLPTPLLWVFTQTPLTTRPKTAQTETTYFAPGAATCRIGRNICVVFNSGLFGLLYKKKTSSTKPEMHDYCIAVRG